MHDCITRQRITTTTKLSCLLQRRVHPHHLNLREIKVALLRLLHQNRWYLLHRFPVSHDIDVRHSHFRYGSIWRKFHFYYLFFSSLLIIFTCIHIIYAHVHQCWVPHGYQNAFVCSIRCVAFSIVITFWIHSTHYYGYNNRTLASIDSRTHTYRQTHREMLWNWLCVHAFNRLAWAAMLERTP